jgi:hypothetical protein
VAELDQRLLDQVLDLLDRRQARRRGPGVGAVTAAERHLDEVGDLGRSARAFVAGALGRACDGAFDEAPLERDDLAVAAADPRDPHGLRLPEPERPLLPATRFTASSRRATRGSA